MVADSPVPHCPSDLALERLLTGEGREVELHVKGCERCQARIAAMEGQGAQYRRTLHAVRARAAYSRADHRWRSRAMLAALVPALAAAASLAVVPLLRTEAPKAVASASPRVEARTPGRALLEPRGGDAPVRLRQVSLRGLEVGFGQGSLEAAPEEGSGPTGPFTLTHTDVDAQVSGFVERVQVTQEFRNPFHERVEAVYVFPLPDNAAVDDMTLVVGSRSIQGLIKKREQARRDYEEAKAQGRRAALLDQERPNIFTQSVANILPGETVKVVIRYVAPLHYDDGWFEFNFPMVVGPRYIPGAPLPGASQGTGTSCDTDRVIDASRITPATLPAGERSGRDIALHLKLDAGFPIEDVASISHRLYMDRPSMRAAEVELAADDRLPNKDFILRWKIAGTELRSALMATRGDGGGYFALMVQPEASEAGRRIVPKEMVFVIDTSGSMSGFPLAAEKRFIRKALSLMNPDDTFMLIDFADRASSFHSTPLPNTPSNVNRAVAYLNALPAGGGTNQLDGIIAALDRPIDRDHLRTVLFLTDGFIGNEAEILDATQKKLGNSRLFSFGVGTSVNHYLLSRLADVGRGFYQYVRPDEDQSVAIERFLRRINKPLMTDVEVNWGGLQVSEILPKKIPDLFDNQPLILLGKYSQPGHARVMVHGHTLDRDRWAAVDVGLPDRDDEHEAIAVLWARAQIEELEKQQYQGEKAEIIRQITSLGLEHRLVTAYTSFVAVDKVHAASANSPIQTVAEPVDLPDKVTMGGDISGKQQAHYYNKNVINGNDGDPTTSKPARPHHVELGKSGYKATDTGVEMWRQDGHDNYQPNEIGLKKPEPTKPTEVTSAPSGATVILDGKSRSSVHYDFEDGEVEGQLAKPATTEPTPTPKPTGKKVDDEFDSIYGGGGDKAAAPEKPARTSPHKDVYIPPAPGSGGTKLALAASEKGALEQSDIMEVVLANRAMIKKCLEDAKAKDPSASGTIVMRWTILPDGTVGIVQTKTPEFQHTPLSACLAAMIKAWRFPPYAGPQMAPIEFPFKF